MRKVNGHKPMQKLYILAISKVRRRVGMKKSWRKVDMAPEVAREYPIWEAWRDG